MKILSNFKDYYDYFQGVYGTDEKVTYNRVCQHLNNDVWVKSGLYKPHFMMCPTLEQKEVESYPIAIGGVLYCVFYYKGLIYFGHDIIEHIKQIKDYSFWNYNRTYNIAIRHLDKTKVNEEEDCPVVLCKWGDQIGLYGAVKNIKLSDFKLANILPDKEVYLLISNFLSREKPVPDNRTNVEKIVSKGFDKKTSFRNL
jgi:hypothetical protein